MAAILPHYFLRKPGVNNPPIRFVRAGYRSSPASWGEGGKPYERFHLGCNHSMSPFVLVAGDGPVNIPPIDHVRMISNPGVWGPNPLRPSMLCHSLKNFKFYTLNLLLENLSQSCCNYFFYQSPESLSPLGIQTQRFAPMTPNELTKTHTHNARETVRG